MSDENHDSSHASGRKRITSRQYSAEDQALNQIASEAETRLAAKRAARAEARDIRLKELERQQREQEEKAKQQELANEANRLPVRDSSASRRSSDDSSETGRESPRELKDATRELKQQLREMEEKYKRAMMTNAQLDNEKHTLVYQVELLKDQIEEQEEGYVQVQREFKEKSRDCELKKRTLSELEADLNVIKMQLEQKDRLIEESGFVIISSEEGQLSLEKSSGQNGPANTSSGSALLSTEMAEMLEKAGEGSLDDKLRKFVGEKQSLLLEVKKLTDALDEEKYKRQDRSPKIPMANGPEMQLYEIQREASKQIHEYKIKLQKAEQDISTLEGSVGRLEQQVKRYKTDAEDYEKMEDELKIEKRKLQRELREAQNQIEELQNQNRHLQKRLEKIKQARNALVNQ